MLPAFFVEGIVEMMSRIYENTGAKSPVVRISLGREFGVRMGIAPGTSADIHTPGGPVEIYCETHQRSRGTFEVTP
jgi:hypothetical protein